MSDRFDGEPALPCVVTLLFADRNARQLVRSRRGKRLIAEVETFLSEYSPGTTLIAHVGSVGEADDLVRTQALGGEELKPTVHQQRKVERVFGNLQSQWPEDDVAASKKSPRWVERMVGKLERVLRPGEEFRLPVMEASPLVPDYISVPPRQRFKRQLGVGSESKPLKGRRSAVST
jgi:hypothetical protein